MRGFIFEIKVIAIKIVVKTIFTQKNNIVFTNVIKIRSYMFR